MDGPDRPVASAWSVIGVATAVAAFAFVLGVVRIGRSFGYDEAITYRFFINEGSPRRALTTQVVFNNHPMFSLLQTLQWRLGLVGETAQRIAPVMFGTATTAIVAAEVGRRRNWIAGGVAGGLVALSPLFLPLYRSLRGYSLATLAVLVAALLIRRSWHDPRRRWLVVQGACMVVAVTTHAYSAVTLLGLVVAAAVLGRVETRHLVTWTASAAVALVIMWPVLDDARANAAARGSFFRAGFPRAFAEFALGDQPVAIGLTAAGLLAGMVSLWMTSRRHALAAGAGGLVIVVAFVLVWAVVQPFDLYARFFVSIVPFVAIVAGLGSALLPRPATAAVGILLGVALWPGAMNTLDVESSIRDTSALVDRARDAGVTVCGKSTEALAVYTGQLRDATFTADDDCDLLITVFTLSPEQHEFATAAYARRVGLGDGMTAWGSANVFADLRLDP